MKKILALFSITLIALFLISCTTKEVTVPIELNIVGGPITLEIDSSHQLEITTNDTLGYNISISNDTVINVTNTGLITATSAGTSIVTVTSKSDDTVSKNVTVTVNRTNNVSITEPTDYLWSGKSIQLSFEATGAVSFQSSDINVATVDDNGLVTAVGSGSFTVTMSLTANATVKTTLDLVVYDVATTIILEGPNKINFGNSIELAAILGPETSAPVIIWKSNNELVAIVDENGIVTALGLGSVTITASSPMSEGISFNHDMVVVNELMVDGNSKLGDKVIIENLEYTFGQTLFNTLEAALDIATKGAHISLYDVSILEANLILVEDLKLSAMNDNVTMSNILTIDASGISITNISFVNEGAIEVAQGASNITLSNNSFDNLNASVAAAIHVQEAMNLTIESNTFNNLEHHAILIDSLMDGALNINKNNINEAGVAIKISGASYSPDTTVQMVRNKISNVVGGFEVLLDETDILAYARFNSVTSYSDFPAKSNAISNVDFTLNYWGVATLDLGKFENISERMLMGHYKTESAIVKEKDYDPSEPLFLYITSALETLWINESTQITFEYLPYELKNARFRYRTSAADTLMVTATGLLQPLMSGEATITVESSIRGSSATDTIHLNVTTDPGIDLIPSVDTNTLIKGDTVTVDAAPYPYTIQNSAIVFESSNTSVATIDAVTGVVTSITSGDVIITARLVDDLEVKQTIYLTFYESLDENNLMDLITMNQQSFLKKHDFYETGTGPSYRVVGYESVSNFYFEAVEVNKTKMIPDQYKGNRVRPGTPLSNIPAGHTTYNSTNVHWITVHDTANTDPSSSALSHANYLLGQAAANGAQVSWHYTIDDYEMYQHIPEGEVAWHAGDGSNLVGSGSYLGGGNRNAISIEMNVGMGDDLYRIWQRTAKFSAETLVKYNLPREHIKFHQHFSGKHCPNALLVSGLEPKFQKMADVEYKVATHFADAQISMLSSNPALIDNAGRVIAMPQYTTTVSYTVTIVLDGVTTSRTFNVYVPGTTR